MRLLGEINGNLPTAAGMYACFRHLHSFGAQPLINEMPIATPYTLSLRKNQFTLTKQKKKETVKCTYHFRHKNSRNRAG